MLWVSNNAEEKPSKKYIIKLMMLNISFSLSIFYKVVGSKEDNFLRSFNILRTHSLEPAVNSMAKFILDAQD